MSALDLESLLDSYLVATDLQPQSQQWYRRVVSVYCGWQRAADDRAELTTESISRFLRDKQLAGRSSHYCRGLRNALLAILGPRINARSVRPVRLERLHPRSWTPAEVAKIIARADILPDYKVVFYRKITAFGWHSGMSKNDLHRVEAAHLAPDGTLVFDRHKTGVTIVAWVPPSVWAGLPTAGPLFPRRWSEEQFRRDFNRMVRAAGLHGSFKQLRKSSGTEADIRSNGAGHTHLANSRKVFEAHYQDRTRIHRQPVKLPRVL